MRNFHVNLTMLRALNALSQSSSLTSVADSLGLSQSAVSHALRGLTEALGEPVTTREGRGLVLTELGRRASTEAREAIAAIERLQDLGRNAPIAGTVTVAAVPSAASAIVPRAISQLRQAFPRLTTSLLEGSDDEVCLWLKDGQADIAIGMKQGTGQAHCLMKDEMFLVASRNHSLASGNTVSLSELSGVPFVMSANGCAPFLADCFAGEQSSPDIVARVRDTASILSMVAAGVGVTILPALSLSALPKSLKSVSFSPMIKRDLWLQHRVAAPSRVQAVLTALEEAADSVDTGRSITART